MIRVLFSILRSIIAIIFSFITNSILVTTFLTCLVLLIDTHKWGWVQSILQWLGRPVNQDNAFGVFFTIFLILPFILSPTRLMAWTLAKLNGWKKAKERDKANIQSALDNIFLQSGIKKKKYHLYIEEVPYMNAAIFGINNIIVTRGMLNWTKGNPKILEGVLSHELGHHYYGHSIVLSFIIVMDTCGMVSLSILEKVNSICGKLLSWIPFVNIIYAIISWIIAIIFGITALFQTITKYIVLWFYRLDEHDADAYACKIGYANELLEGLKLFKTEADPEEKKGILANLGKDHPSLQHRIETIEKYLEKHKETPTTYGQDA